MCASESKNSSAAMLTTKRSTGVAPEVTLRNSLHTGDEKLDLKARIDVTRGPKQGYKWPHKKD